MIVQIVAFHNKEAFQHLPFNCSVSVGELFLGVRVLLCRDRPSGRIELLTHLAYFGYCFNPASFYYVWDAAGVGLEAVVIEVSNTQW